MDGVVPAYIIKEEDSWFSDHDFDWLFGLHVATGRKLVIQDIIKERFNRLRWEEILLFLPQ